MDHQHLYRSSFHLRNPNFHLRNPNLAGGVRCVCSATGGTPACDQGMQRPVITVLWYTAVSRMATSSASRSHFTLSAATSASRSAILCFNCSSVGSMVAIVYHKQYKPADLARRIRERRGFPPMGLRVLGRLRQSTQLILSQNLVVIMGSFRSRSPRRLGHAKLLGLRAGHRSSVRRLPSTTTHRCASSP